MRLAAKFRGESEPANRMFEVCRFLQDKYFVTKSGDLGLVLSVRGMDPSSSTSEMLESYGKQLASALRSLPEEIRIYQYLIKRPAPPIKMADGYGSEEVLETVRARNNAIQSRGLYAVDLYWAFIYESGSLINGRRKKSAIKADRVYTALMSDLERDAAILSSRTDAFLDETRQLLAGKILTAGEAFQFMRRLGNFDDTQAASLPWTPDEGIDNFLLDETPEIYRTGFRLGDQSVQVLSTREVVKSTSPNMLSEVIESKCGVIVCLEYKRVSAQQANTESANAQNHFENAAFLATLIGFVRLAMAKGDTSKLPPDSAAKKNADEAGEVMKRLNASDSLGEFSATVVLHSPDPVEVKEATAATIRAFGRHGGSLYRETYNALFAYQSIFPGNTHRNFRRLWLLQSNFAETSLMYAPAPGEERNAFLNREYLLVAETNSHTPHYFNLHWGDVFNTFACGMTGAGKSVWANIVLDHFQKYDPRTLILDIGGSYRHTCTKHGGSYVSLDFSNKEWSINPFLLPETHENVEFLDTFVRLLLVNSRYQPTYADDQPIREAIEEIYQRPIDERRLGNLKLPDRLKTILYLWIGRGPYAGVFDNEEDTLEIAKFQVFDLGGLEKYPRVMEPLLFYIFRRQQALVEDPTLREVVKVLWCDETWRFLANETCKRQFVTAGKTYRKFNAGMGLVTQSSADLENVGLLETISEICPTKVFLANPSANFRAYAERFHWNEAEVENFKGLVTKRQFMVKKAEEPAVVLNLHLSPLELAMYGNSPLDNVKRDAAIEKHGWREGLRRLAAAG